MPPWAARYFFFTYLHVTLCQLTSGYIRMSSVLTCSYASIRHRGKSLISNVLVTRVTEMTPSDFFSWLKSIITMRPTRGRMAHVCEPERFGHGC